MDDSFYRFKLIFKGDLIANSVDAYDVANTILGATSVISEIASIRFAEQAKNLKINISAFKQGSLESSFLVYLDNAKDAIAPVLPLVYPGYKIGKEILATFKTYLDVRTALKGKPPQKVIPQQDGLFNIIGDNNRVTIAVSANELRALQDKNISRHVEKMVGPLGKEGYIENIAIEDNEAEIANIDRGAAKYLQTNEQFQSIPNITYKGVVSKIDTKTGSGFLDIASKRLSFSFPRNLEKIKFHILVESLEGKMQIFLIGSVEMDYEANPKHMEVLDILRDEKLF